VVDLKDVTFIDENGEALLSEMRAAGVEFIATGVETKHLLENLKDTGKRAKPRIGSWLCRSGAVSFDKTTEADAHLIGDTTERINSEESL
jgi:hypothetical protein